MRILFAASVLLGFSAMSAVADLDLTPRSMRIAGGLVNRTYFQDGDKKYAVTIDDETRVTAFEDGAMFRFTNLAQASMRLRRSPFAKPAAFGAESLADYHKAAERMIPAGAEALAILNEGENVFPINQWKSYRIVYSYQVGGLGFMESFTFLFLDSGQQILIHTGSPRKDFEAVAARADDIVRRWHEVLPGDEAGLN